MWRFKDWEYGAWQKDERFLRDPPININERLYNAYEAGADAMLEAVLKASTDGTHLKGTYFGEKGTFVFIPEETQDE